MKQEGAEGVALSRDSRRRRFLVAAGIGCAVLCVGILAWNFPARLALPWIAPRLPGLALHDVHGSVWDGRAGQVVTRSGRTLGSAQWRVSRRVLLQPEPITLRVDGAAFAFSGTVRFAGDGRSTWSDVRLRTDAALWPALAAALPGAPRGEWRLTAPRATLHNGWPVTLDLHGEWRDAALHVHGRWLALGTLAWDADARGGVVHVRIHDVPGGPLRVHGDALVGPLGWRLDARLQARPVADALRSWLATLGPLGADGSLRLARRGGLAPLLPSATGDAGPRAPPAGTGGAR